jgi:uncharacterized protein YdhG (YjbR/CyaY superfamily)
MKKFAADYAAKIVLKQMNPTPTTIDEYLATVDAEKRAALERLRDIVKAAAPAAQEPITYRIPMFRLNGMLVGFAAAKDHCSFYPCDSTTVKALKNELKNYETSKGAIQFQPNKPLPVALVKKIVKARVAANDAKCAERLRKARKARSR